jgi:hypothetical protein
MGKTTEHENRGKIENIQTTQTKNNTTLFTDNVNQHSYIQQKFKKKTRKKDSFFFFIVVEKIHRRHIKDEENMQSTKMIVLAPTQNNRLSTNSTAEGDGHRIGN